MFCECNCNICKIIMPYRKFQWLCAVCDKPPCNKRQHKINKMKINTLNKQIKKIRSDPQSQNSIELKSYCDSCLTLCQTCTSKYHKKCTGCVVHIMKNNNICICAQPLMYHTLFDDLVKCHRCQLDHPINVRFGGSPHDFSIPVNINNILYLSNNKYYCHNCTSQCFLCNKRNLLESCRYCETCLSIICCDCVNQHQCKMIDTKILLIANLTLQIKYYKYSFELKRQLLLYRLLSRQMNMFIVNGHHEMNFVNYLHRFKLDIQLCK